MRNRYGSDSRLEIKLLEVIAEPTRPRCVRFHMVLQDRTDTKWYSEQYALSCGLKKYKGMGVELRYFDRYYDQIETINWQKRQAGSWKAQYSLINNQL